MSSLDHGGVVPRVLVVVLLLRVVLELVGLHCHCREPEEGQEELEVGADWPPRRPRAELAGSSKKVSVVWRCGGAGVAVFGTMVTGGSCMSSRS